jgi:hypothetical protein
MRGLAPRIHIAGIVHSGLSGLVVIGNESVQ